MVIVQFVVWCDNIVHIMYYTANADGRLAEKAAAS